MCILVVSPFSIDLIIKALKYSNEIIPTDENGVSNSDCIQFGLDNYEQVDDILKIIYYPETPRKVEYFIKEGRY